MKEIICTTQVKLDAVAADFDGRVIIKFGTPHNRAVVNRRFKYSVEASDNSSVEAWDNSSVVAYDYSSVVACGNSSVVAWDNSSVVAYDYSSVVAWGNSSVVARGNSSVVAWDNSSVVARGNSSVEARGNSSVEARDNSSVVAWDNSQIVDAGQRKENIRVSGNARIVYNPSSIEEYIDFHGLDADGGTVKLYKAVHLDDGIYRADYDPYFIYTIGKNVEPTNGFSDSVLISCGAGIHLAHKAWAVSYGANWRDLAILECECAKDDVLVPLYSDGKVRARKVKVLREVPIEECGLYGKMLAKRRVRK